MKKQLKAKVALLMLVAATALTGCGKSKNNTVGAIGAGPVPVAPTYPGGFYNNTLTVGGSLVISNASYTTYSSYGPPYGADFTATSGSVGGAYTFTRSSYYGSVTLYVASMPTTASSGYTQTTGTAVVNLTAEAVSLFQSCGAAPGRVYIGTVQLINGQITTSVQVGDTTGRCSLRI